MKQHILELPIQEWQKKLLKRMIKVNWYESGLDKVHAISDFNFYDKDKDNNGYIYGIYFLCTKQEFDDVMWYKTEEERDSELEKLEMNK
jgi:uncharacterized protein YfdQ (DUF2303 family)